jgi:hypothetical protein
MRRRKTFMKRSIFYPVLICVCVLCSAPAVFAGINVFEPLIAGKDTSIGPANSYEFRGTGIFLEQQTEVPFDLVFNATTKMQVGGRLGLISIGGETGLDDMLLGLKYQFQKQFQGTPAVVGEIAISLPTGENREGLGTGAVGLLLNWILEKDIEAVTGYLDLGVELNAENSDQNQAPNTFSFQLGARYPYVDNLNFFAELKGFNHGKQKIAGSYLGETTNELYLAPGVSYTWQENRTLSGSLLFGMSSDSNTLGFVLSTNF